MSLLNQVLLDLEKNAKDKPEKTLLNHVKAVSQKKQPAYLFMTFLIGGAVIASLLYLYLPKEKPVSAYSSADLNVTEEPWPIKAQSKLAHPITKTVLVELPLPQPPFLAQKETIVIEPQKTKFVTTLPTPNIKIIEPKPKVIKKKIHLHLTSEKEKTDHLFIQATKEVNVLKKQQNLKKILDINPRHTEARLLLSKSLLENGLTSEAATTLDNGLLIVPQQLQLINMRSQIFLQKRQTIKALETLLLVDTNYIENEMYLSLLAVAYQQNNNYVSSLKTYQTLLKNHPNKAEYWLGLAIGYEQQKQTPQALHAYQQALSKKSLKIGIVNYIKDRIRILKHL